MKRPILFALIFTFGAISSQARPAAEERSGTLVRETIVLRETAYVLPASLNTLTAAEAYRLPPIAARISRENLARPRQTISGVLPRMAATRRPAEMLSPFASVDRGAGWNLLSYPISDPYRNDRPGTAPERPNSLRLLGVRGIW